MQDIKRFLFIIIIAFSFFTCTDEEPISFDDSIGSFVRFRLQVDNNNNVIEKPSVDNATPTVSSYTKDNFKELKIPVALTTKSIEEIISVEFEADIKNILGVEITPSNQLRFTKTQRVDTIYVKFNDRWDVSKNPEIIFSLISSTRSDVNIGIPNDSNPENELIVNFSKLDFSYQFAPPNSKEIIGNKGEQVEINVVFPDGYVLSEIKDKDFLLEQSSNFDYNLVKREITDPTKITYILTVNENIAVDVLEFKTIFEMNNLDNYTLVGNNRFTITKPIFVERDNNTNTAYNFYNLSNPFYRTYGENWLFDPNDNKCEWSSFFAFTYPVVVTSDHPNAVLFDDKGTPNTSDDIYHHAFRIGFNSPNLGNTTNSFNLKRWFTNESINAANSPGFNIPEALEFFPDNGNSTDRGIVRVIEQDLIIAGTNGNSYVIQISGEGTYKKINTEVFEINLTLQATNNSLFGGTIESQYFIYNSNNYPDPVDLNENCVVPSML